MRHRWLTVVPFVALAALLPGCFVLGRDLPTAQDTQNVPAPSVPEVDLWLNGSGGDAIDVWWNAWAPERLEVAEGVARWLGVANPIALDNELLSDTASVQLDRRLATMHGSDWVFDVETTGLASVLEGAKQPVATLVICTPKVDPSFVGGREPDLAFDEVSCDFDGRGWNVAASDSPLAIRVTMRPDAGDYLTFAAAVLLGVVLLGALAWWVGDRLRRGPFRRRNGASVAIGLIAGVFSAFALAGAVVSAASFSGAADNLALARDMTLGGEVSSVAFPALIAAVPGIVFATLLIRQRRWSDEREPGIPPPGTDHTASVAPPPLPWEPR